MSESNAKAAVVETAVVEAPNVAAVVEAVAFNPAIMRIQKRVGGDTKFVKFLAYGLPTLDMIPGYNLPAPDKWSTTELEEGEEKGVINTPVYDSQELDYIQTALTQRIQGIARTKDGAGAVPPSNWVELFEASGGSKYPVQLRDFKAGLAEWLSTQENLSEKQQVAILGFCNTQKLVEQSDAKKERISAYFEAFIEAIENPSEVAAVITNIRRAIATTPEDVDF